MESFGRPLRVLWTSNIPLYPIQNKYNSKDSVASGSWMNGLLMSIRESNLCKLAIISTTSFESSKDTLSCDIIDDNLSYYHFQRPKYKYPYRLKDSSKFIDIYQSHLVKVIEEFNPDIIHVHGTEEPWGLIKHLNEIHIPLLISIQGINLLCSYKAWGDMTFWGVTKIQRITPRSIYRLFPTLWKRRALRLRAKLEVPMLKSADCIIGRTLWDKAFSKGIAPNTPYRVQNEILRKEFYNQRWSIDNIERYTIYASGRCTLAKGVHVLLKAIRILVVVFPNIKLNYAGVTNKYDSEFMYINRLIEEYKLENNVKFCGHLNSNRLTKLMLNSHCFVSPSFVENSPNSLQEAQSLGMPCVVTNVGGVPSLVEDKKSSLMCDPGNEYMLALQISRIFRKDELAIELSLEARNTAIERNNIEKITRQLRNIYTEFAVKK